MSKIDTLIEIAQDIRALLDRKLVGEPLHCAKCEHQSNTMLTKQQVMDYLNISESTYKRQVKSGILQPMDLGGGHCYYPSDLQEALYQSRRRGRV